jgi:hypothetical protein
MTNENSGVLKSYIRIAETPQNKSELKSCTRNGFYTQAWSDVPNNSGANPVN